MKISEHFYSIQGEGFSVGVPAYFIRLPYCNLTCGGTKGQLVKEGKATWFCDSETIWRQSTEVSFDELIDHWQDEQILTDIIDNKIHIVWTGGEPTLPNNQQNIIDFINHFEKRFNIFGNRSALYNEIETNGTRILRPELFRRLDQINCSPKLANSGLSSDVRIIPEVLKQINEHPNGTFKFVISEEKDMFEIQNSFILAHKLDESRVCLMPGVDNSADLPERTRFIFEMAKKYGYRAITRQHILAWNKTVGV